MNPLNFPDNELVLRYQGFVRSVALTAWKSTLGNVELEDLISYGQVGLVQAARSYDSTSGVEFATYAFYRVRGAIFDGYTSMQWLSRAQYRCICLQQLSDEVIEQQELGSQNLHGQEQPDDAEWSAEVIGKLFVVHLALEMGDGTHPSSQVEDPSSISPSEALVSAELQATIQQAVHALPPEERNLIESVYYEGKSLTATAKVLGKSKSWASRLHDRALQRLLRKLNTAEFAAVTL